MKKYYSFALLGAIALSGAVFTACSSSDDVADVNPTFDGEAVKTTFTISVGDVKSPTTRMAADPVQQDQQFNGMTDIYLFPAKAAITGTTVTSESYINLPDFTAFSGEVTQAQGKIYSDVAFSVGVNNFLFYAASKTPGNGKLRASYLKMPMAEFHGTADWDPEPLLTSSVVENIHFDLVPIQKEMTLAKVKELDAAIASIKPLNDVDAKLTEQITAAGAGSTAATELTALQNVLRNDLSTTPGTPDYKPYAGSSLSQKALMTKVYTAVKNLETLITTTYTQPILAAIEALFTVSGDADAGFTLTWKTDPEFPSSDDVLGLPDGSAAVQFNGTKFDYVTPSVDGLSVPDFTNYVYPARLYYTINTPAMVKNEEYLSTLTDQYATWADVKTNGAYTEGAVAATTRSVIMKDQVQYAVGRLDVQVRVKPNATITDSGSKDLLDGSSNPIPQPVTVPAGGYKLTGVLIGGQKNVAWDFTPTGTDEFTIWDKVMGNEIFAKQQTAYAGDNYTLALETAANTKIKIALEFENTGNDFYGIDHNIIPAGTKFYLVAELDPDPEKHNFVEQDPETPWNDRTTKINQVFKQDYVTTAKLTINETALQKAYNVVPDLRSPKLEFGLSVDLHWRTGITFEQDFQ